jgi:homocysteine S-methyltransferase
LELPLPIWSADINLTHPNYIEKIHKSYLDAGADILTTNTFRTTPRAYSKNGFSKDNAILRSHKSLDRAVELARKVANRNTIIAGSIAPLEDCYEPNLYPGDECANEEFRELARWLQEAGVNMILFETMGCWFEIKSAILSTNDLKIPRWISLVLKDGNELLDGTDLTKVLYNLLDFEIEMILLNCNPYNTTNEAIELFLENWTKSWGVYPNVGLSMPSKEGIIESKLSVDVFMKHVNSYIDAGASVIGACCGSNPSYIKAMRDLINLKTK